VEIQCRSTGFRRNAYTTAYGHVDADPGAVSTVSSEQLQKQWGGGNFSTSNVTVDVSEIKNCVIQCKEMGRI